MRHRYVTFAALIVASIIAGIDLWFFGGLYVIGPLLWMSAYAWRGLVYAVDVLVRGLLYQIGWRRLFRPFSVITMGGIGLGYLITNPKRLRKARGWRGKLIVYMVQLREWWHQRHFFTKFCIVAILIAAQVSFHFWVLLFPVGFLVSGIAYALRRAQIHLFDEYLGTWYWKSLRKFHRSVMHALRSVPIISHGIAGARSLKLSFKCGWRLWKHDPRFRDPWKTGRAHPVEGRLRLARAWRLGEWRKYHGRPLLAGEQNWPKRVFAPRPWYAQEDKWYAPFVSTIIVVTVMLFVMDFATDARVIPSAIENALFWWR